MDWPVEHNPKNPDATPDYDEWGWDDYWNARDWQDWHTAMLAAYGKATADQRWIAAWLDQGYYASPDNELVNSAPFRAWLKSSGLLKQVESLGQKIGGLTTDLVSTTTDVAGTVADNAGKIVNNLTGAAAESSGAIVWVTKHPLLTAAGVAAVLGVGLGVAVLVKKNAGATVAAAIG
jgi:hypothetical protein